MTWSLVQKSAAYNSSGNSNTLPSASTAGNLLVATCSTGTPATITPPSGWSTGPTITNSTTSQTTMFFYFNNPGGLSSFAFTGPTGTCKVSVAEFTCANVAHVSAASATGTQTGGAVTNITITGGSGTVAGDLCVVGGLEHVTTSATCTWTDPSGYTLENSDTAASTNHSYCARNLSASASGAQSVTLTNSLTANGTGWTGVFASFTEPNVLLPPGARQGARQQVTLVRARTRGMVPAPPAVTLTPVKNVRPRVSYFSVRQPHRRQQQIISAPNGMPLPDYPKPERGRPRQPNWGPRTPHRRWQQPIPAPFGQPLPIYPKPLVRPRIPAAFVRPRRQQVVPPVWVPVRIPGVRRVILLPSRRGRPQSVPGGLPPLQLKKRMLFPLAWYYTRRRSGLVPPVTVVAVPPTPSPSRQPLPRWFGLRPVRRQQTAPPAPAGFPLPDYPKPQRPALARWLGFRWKRTQQMVPAVQAPPVAVVPPTSLPRRLRALAARRGQAQPVPPTMARLSARARKPLSLVGARPRPLARPVPAVPRLAQPATRRARLAGLLRRLAGRLPFGVVPPPVAFPGYVTITNHQVEPITLFQAAPAVGVTNANVGGVVAISNTAPGVNITNVEVGQIGVSNA